MGFLLIGWQWGPSRHQHWELSDDKMSLISGVFSDSECAWLAENAKSKSVAKDGDLGSDLGGRAHTSERSSTVWWLNVEDSQSETRWVADRLAALAHSTKVNDPSLICRTTCM